MCHPYRGDLYVTLTPRPRPHYTDLSSSYLWGLGGGQLLRDEAEHMFSSHWLQEVDDECKLCPFSEKHKATVVVADALGKERKGYVV